MTARRLRRKNKPDVARFLYVPLPIGTVSFVGSGNARVVVEGRDWPCFAANHRSVASCRILSQSVVIGRLRHKTKNICSLPSRRLLAVSIFVEGSSCEFQRIATENFLSRRCSAIPLQSVGSFPRSTVSRSAGPKMAETAKYLSGKPSAIPLFVKGSFKSV
jgi:hypothetical protein